MLLALLAGGAGAVIVAMSTVSSEPVVETFGIDVPDRSAGTDRVTLDAALYLPEQASVDAPAPAVLLAHGFLSDRLAVDPLARELTDDGYAVVTWSARGFGQSEGEIALADPDREIADVSVLLDVLADREDIIQDGPDDPRVGIVGASYGGGTALLAAVADGRLDAVVASAAWADLSASLAPNGIVGADTGVLATGWTSLLFSATGLPRDTPELCGRFVPAVCNLYVEAATSGVLARSSAVLDRASPAGRVDDVTAPTLLIQGQQDTLFGLAASRQNAAGIAATGTPVRLRWLPGGHDVVGSGLPSGEAREELDAWLGRWLTDGADGRDPITPFTWTDEAADRPRDRGQLPDGEPRDGLQVVVSADGRLVGADDAPAVAGPLRVLSPAGGRPAALSTLPGAGGFAGLLPRADIPGQHVNFDTQPVAQDITLLGPPRLRLTLDADGDEVRVFVKLYDVAPNGDAALLQRAVTPVRATDLPATVDITLADLAHRLVRDHRLRLTVATTDQAFANRTEPAVVSVTLDPAVSTLHLPTVATPSADGLGPAGTFLAAAATALTMVGIAGWLVRRRRDDGSTDLDIAGAPPIVIRGLTKRYADGFLAVDDLDVTVERGQVVGLLGPNGAGKTSALRMLLGLASPDAGTIEIFGHRMRPGHPVLHHVGALVEGPGFSPELSGLDNLQLYWRAGGRPLDDADLPWVLSVADLGDAIHKPVRTYSHGMKQRLAIAQALMGRPALLVLDEPTDGLDPEQIRSMRQLLAGLGDAGHTVLVSSHLLAEVEQMCTHVVVVQGGQLRADGSVAELVGTTRTVVVDTDDRAAARTVLLEHLAASAIEVSGSGLAVSLGGHDAADIVAWLVAAGQRVRAVTPRGTLEDAFLSLTRDQP